MNQLIKALNNIKKYAAPKSTMEILQHVKLDLHNYVLTLTTTDMEATAITSTSMFGENFAVTTNLQKLESVVKSMIDPLQLSVDSDKLVVSDKNSKAILSTLPVGEFPHKPEKGKWLGHLDLASIKRVCLFASSQYADRIVLQTILVKLSGNEVIFSGVDSFKLATIITEFRPADDFEPTEFLVPAAALAKLSGRKHLDASVTIFSGEGSSYATFRMNNFELIVTLVEGKFPNYNHIIPNEFSGELIVGVKDWKDALKMLTLVAGDNLGITRGYVKGDSLVISAKDGERNIVEKGIPVFSSVGNIPQFALKLKDIKPVLEVCATRNIRVKFGSQAQNNQDYTKSPLIFRDVVSDSEQPLSFIESPQVVWQALCMPMFGMQD